MDPMDRPGALRAITVLAQAPALLAAAAAKRLLRKLRHLAGRLPGKRPGEPQIEPQVCRGSYLGVLGAGLCEGQRPGRRLLLVRLLPLALDAAAGEGLLRCCG
jgi:hypothetical protein